MQHIALRFLKNHGPYPKHTLASFPPLSAQQLIRDGVAERYIEPHKADPATDPLPPRRGTKSITTK